MSEKEVDGTVIAEELLKENDVIVVPVVHKFPRYGSLVRHQPHDYVVAEFDVPQYFPPSVTDQTHGLSLAEQVRRGQVSANFDEESPLTDDNVEDSMLPFYNREEFSMKEQEFIARMSEEAKRRTDERSVMKDVDSSQKSSVEQSSSVSEGRESEARGSDARGSAAASGSAAAAE